MYILNNIYSCFHLYHNTTNMESAKRERVILATASSNCLVRFSFAIFQYVGSSCEMRAVCSAISSTIAANVTVVRVLCYLPLHFSLTDGQNKILEILRQRPRMKTVDLSNTCFIEEHLVSFGWFVFTKCQCLDEIRMINGCNAIICSDYMRGYYASFRPNSLHTRQTVIAVLFVALANEDMNTIQKFSYSVQCYMELGMMPSKHYTCTYLEDEEPGSFFSQCCIGDVTNQFRDHFSWKMIKSQEVWRISRVRSLNGSNFCDVCWM